MELKESMGDLILGIVSVIVGVAIYILTKVQGLEFIRKGMPGPGMFSILCAVAIVFCGALLCWETVAYAKKGKANSEVNEEQEKNLINVHELKNLLIFLILGVFILTLSNTLGLLTCLCVSMIAYMKIQGKEPWWKAVAVSVGCSIFLYSVFIVFLRVPVPKGPLGF